MKTVLITGANRGIGLALTRHYIERGDKVIAVCRNAGDDLQATGARVESGVDVTDADAVAALARRLEQDGAHLDVLLLNAGVLTREALGSIDEAGFEAMRRQFEVNTIAPLRVAQALLPRLGEGSKVAIITSRMGSMTDNGSGGSYGYRASKAAVNAIGKSLAVDLAPRGIAVLLLHPGYVATDMVGGKGDVQPAESAAGLVERIDELGIDDTGSFWHAKGDPLPW